MNKQSMGEATMFFYERTNKIVHQKQLSHHITFYILLLLFYNQYNNQFILFDMFRHGTK